MKIQPEPRPINCGAKDYERFLTTLDLLAQNEKFEEFITNFRKEHSVHTAAQKSQTSFKKTSSDLSVCELRDLADYYLLAKRFNLNPEWGFPLYNFIHFNIFTFPISFTMKPYYHIEYYKPSDESGSLEMIMCEKLMQSAHSGQVVIIIKSKKVSKDGLRKWVEKNWKQLQPLIEKIPTPPIHEMRRFDLAQEIAELRDKKNMTYGKIVSELRKNHCPDDLDNEKPDYCDLLNEDYVRILCTEYKKILQRN